MILDPMQIRVLGALIEKEIVTPETYPLSLNALIAACNQRSSREPVMDLAEDEVQQALHLLEDLELTSTMREGRVPKYEHRIRTVLNLRRDETAILCLLFLRGPQTPGELRSRADRMYSFDGLGAVEGTLARLMAASSEEQSPGVREMRPLVAVLPKQAGSREARYVHLLAGPVQAAGRNTGGASSQSELSASSSDAADRPAAMPLAARVAGLEGEVAALRAAVASIEARLGATGQNADAADAADAAETNSI